jgi:signal peptidase II
MQATRGTPLTVGEHEAPRTTRPVRIALLVSVAIVVLGLDALSKSLVVAQIPAGHTIHVVDDVLRLTEARNAGAAFSIGPGATVLFTLIAIGVVGAIIRSARRLGSRAWAMVLGLLLGGALGNLADRLFRSPGPLRGHVVDWIQLPHWPVFNLADSAIVIGGVIAVLLVLRGIGLDGR